MKRKELFIVATIALILVGCSPKATTESYCLMNNTDETLTISSISKSKDVFPGEGYVITDITHYEGQDISGLSEIYEEMFWNAPNWKETDCIRKGTVIPIYAKTENSETIDGVTASWYYMSMPTLSDYNLYGWIFGCYFEDYDESRKEEYAEILRKEFE